MANSRPQRQTTPVISDGDVRHYGQGLQSIGTADHRSVFAVAGTDPYAWKDSAPPSPDAVHLRNHAQPGNAP